MCDRRVEIGFARAETDDVLAFGLELRDSAGQRNGRRRLDALDALEIGRLMREFPLGEGWRGDR